MRYDFLKIKSKVGLRKTRDPKDLLSLRSYPYAYIHIYIFIFIYLFTYLLICVYIYTDKTYHIHKTIVRNPKKVGLSGYR